jgi:hypothetical protein
MQSSSFWTYVFLVFYVGATLNNTPLKYTCPIKKIIKLGTSPLHVSAWRQCSKSTTVSKTLHVRVGIIIAMLRKTWYLVGMSRWDNLCIPKLSFGSIPLWTILILGRICLDMKVLAWKINLNGIRVHSHTQFLIGIKKIYEILDIDTQAVSKKKSIKLDLV